VSVSVQNIYYLLCYAWDRLEARQVVDVEAIPGNRVENLLGQVFRDGVAHLIRQGLDRGYVGFVEEGRRLRGKLVLADTVQRTLLPRGRVACQLDELSHDVPHNRVIKAAMSALIGLPGLDHTLRTGLRNHCRRMERVADVELSTAAFRGVQLHRNLARYAFLFNVCRLVARSLLPEDRAGRRRFHPFTASQQEMGTLFEAFVRNFLRREQEVFHVAAAKVPWHVEAIGASDPSWLPEMRTDVMLTSPARRVAIETKYYATSFQSHHGSKTLISGHLYQLSTYLAHLRATPGPDPVGVLLYASAGEAPRLDYRLGGHRVLIRHLDLSRDWREIHRDLLSLARECEEARESHRPA
jgi:5-methylcytosine-specific restriction enzyme subunit McrC